MIHNQEKKVLKFLPCGAKKGQVFRMYASTPEDTIRDTMHYCLRKCNPHWPEEKIKNSQWLSRNVLKEIVAIEGPPSGYLDQFRE